MTQENSLREYIDNLSKYALNISIIYTEDELLAREQVEKLLLRFFSDVRVASDGDEALALYKKRKSDLVITDIVMPNMDGLELCTAIREIDSEQKIIVISAHGDYDKLISMIDIGIDKFLLKPVDNKQFMRKLYEVSREIYERKQNIILYKKLEENLASMQNIIELMNDALVIVESGMIVMANKSFLTLAKVTSLEELLQKSERIDYLFMPVKGYLSHCSNEELVGICKNNETVRVVINGVGGVKILLVGCGKLNAKSYILTFVDVTTMEKEILVSRQKLQINPITHIFNKTALIDKFKEKITTDDLVLILVSFDQFSQLVKLYGREIAMNAERLFVDSTKDILDTNSFGNKVYFANYDKNAFVLICDKKSERLLSSAIFDKEIILANVNIKTQGEQLIKFKPLVKTLDFSKGSPIKESLEVIDREFASINPT